MNAIVSELRIDQTTPFVCFTPELRLASIQKSFDEIPKDPHFKPGYRWRTQSRFKYNGGNIERLPPVPLYQPLHINPYANYGGKAREYSDLPDWVTSDAAFNALVTQWIETLNIDVDLFSAHQIRTVGSGSEPVPEGRHRDGYDYVGVYVVRRHNIRPTCAKTTVWEGQSDKILFEGVLKEGELLACDDRRVTHYVDAIESLDGGECLRDVIILTVPDQCIG